MDTPKIRRKFREVQTNSVNMMRPEMETGCFQKRPRNFRIHRTMWQTATTRKRPQRHFGWTGQQVDESYKMGQHTKELEVTQKELACQKNLKQVPINKDKATCKELERLEKASDPDTPSTTGTKTEVQNTVENKTKEELQKEYEALSVSHVTSQQKYEAELRSSNSNQQKLEADLQAQRDTTEALLEEVKQLKASLSSAMIQPKLEAELQAQKDRNEGLLEEVKQLRASLSSNGKQKLEADLWAQRITNEALLQQLKASESSKTAALETTKTLLAQKDNIICQMGQMIQSLKAEASKSERSFLELLKAQKDSLDEQWFLEVEKGRQLCKQLLATKGELTSQLAKQMASLQEQLQILQRQNSVLKKEVGKLEDQGNASKKACDDLKKSLKFCTESNADLATKLQDEKEALQKEVQRNALLQQQNSDLDTKLQAEQDAHFKIVQKNALLEAENSYLQGEVSQLKEAQNTKDESLSAEIPFNKDLPEALQQDIEKLEDRNNATTKRFSKFLRSVRQKLKASITVNEDLTNQLQAERKISEGLRTELVQLSEAPKTNQESLSAEIQFENLEEKGNSLKKRLSKSVRATGQTWKDQLDQTSQEEEEALEEPQEV